MDIADYKIPPVTVNDRTWTVGQMTFAMQREWRRAVVRLASEDGIDVEDIPIAHVLAATVYVCAREEDPTYTIEKALQLSADEIFPEKPEDAGAGEAGEPDPTTPGSAGTP